jgi:hypothetical protein
MNAGKSFAVVAALVAVTVGVRGAAAQDPEMVEAPKIGCFRGQPLPACKSFWLVEMEYGQLVGQTSRTVTFAGQAVKLELFSSTLDWNLGHMVNVDPTFALGGQITLGAGPGVGVRARRWMGPDNSAEAALTLWRHDTDSNRGVGGGRVTSLRTDARLNYGDRLSILVRWDAAFVRSDNAPRQMYVCNSSGGGCGNREVTDYSDPGGLQNGLSLGVGIGSKPAVITSCVFASAVLVLVSMLPES